MGRPALRSLAETGRRVELAPGQTLLEEGKQGRHVCVLLSGRVRMSRVGPSGREVALGVLEAGAVFGEYALLPPGANTVTCRARDSGEALLLPLRLIEAVLKWVRGVGDNVKAWLRLHSLLHHFRHSAGLGFQTGLSLVPMLARCHELTFAAGNTLQADGLLPGAWLFVQRGEVTLSDGKAEVSLGPGGCFGERALLGRSRLPTAIARTETVCWQLARDDFRLPFDGSVSNTEQTARPPVVLRRWEWLAQRGPSDCGVAALAIALRGGGHEVSFEELAKRVPPRAGGLTLADLARAAEGVGARATPVRVGVEQLGHARLPAVAHLSGEHFVTLFELGVKTLLVSDPASGVRAVPRETFRGDWSGHLLLLRPAPDAPF
jgi:CRP-like cAMP-binding protein